MLKITKGLMPTDGIMTYIDDRGDEYVRVKIGDEDFCIAARDYTPDGKHNFTWNEAMKLMKEEGMTMLTKEQVELYKAFHNEINSKLKEIDGEALENVLYWTMTAHDGAETWGYWGDSGNIYYSYKDDYYSIRPVLNLK